MEHLELVKLPALHITQKLVRVSDTLLWVYICITLPTDENFLNNQSIKTGESFIYETPDFCLGIELRYLSEK